MRSQIVTVAEYLLNNALRTRPVQLDEVSVQEVTSQPALFGPTVDLIVTRAPRRMDVRKTRPSPRVVCLVQKFNWIAPPWWNWLQLEPQAHGT